MHRMPYALGREQNPVARDGFETQIERMATMADPLGTPLPSATFVASLDAQFVTPRAVPVRTIEPVARGYRLGEAARQVGAHASASAVPNNRSVAGVTIGPEMTRPTRASGT